MSAKGWLGLGVCCLVVAACGSDEPAPLRRGEGLQELRIISVENSTRSVIRRIIVLDAYRTVRQRHTILYNEEVYAEPGVYYPVFLQVRVCEMIIKVEYLDGSTSEAEPQDFCRQSQVIFRESSIEIPPRTAIVANA